MLQEGYVFNKVGYKKYKQEHRQIIENLIGRELISDEIIHHKDKNKLNNNWDNLEILTRAEHINIHRKELTKN